MCRLPIERTALGYDDVPATQVGTRPRITICAANWRELVDEIVVATFDPLSLQVRRRRIFRKDESHEIDEPLLVRAALDAAAPCIRGADRRCAKCIDLRTVVPLKVAPSLGSAW